MKPGACKLCGLEKDLLDSHYLPRSVYKSNREKTLRNQNPIILGAKVRQDQEQVTDYVFCADCEERFSKHGESWVLRRIPHEYGQSFELQDALRNETPFFVGPGINLYAGAKISAFDMDKLVYFAASIFWRGAVHRWKTNRGELTPEVNLGKHAEVIRKFLLGEATFPHDVWLTVIVWPFTKILNAGFVPASDDPDGWNSYWFYVSGLGFVVHYGDAVPLEIKQRCAQNTPQRVITIERAFGDVVWDWVREEVRAAETPELRALLEEINRVRAIETSATAPSMTDANPGPPRDKSSSKK